MPQTESIDRLREGVRQIGLSEPVIALAPFMGDVADQGLAVVQRVRDALRLPTPPDLDATGKPVLDYKDLVAKGAAAIGLDPAFVHRLVTRESNYNPAAVSTKGARGIMQLMPTTAKGLGVNADDPLDNITGGLTYLHSLLTKYGGDTRKAAAAYNAGPTAVDRHGGVPPYAETRAYVDAVAPRGQKPPDLDEAGQVIGVAGKPPDLDEQGNPVEAAAPPSLGRDKASVRARAEEFRAAEDRLRGGEAPATRRQTPPVHVPDAQYGPGAALDMQGNPVVPSVPAAVSPAAAGRPVLPPSRLGSAKTGGAATQPAYGQSPLDIIPQGAAQLAQGAVAGLGGGVPTGRVASAKTGGTATESPLTPKEFMGAGADIIEGIFKLSTPIMASAAIRSLPEAATTAYGIVRAVVAAKVGEKGAELVGASPEAQRLTGDVTALLSGGLSATRFLDKVRADARAVMEQARAFDAANPQPEVPSGPRQAGAGATPEARGRQRLLEAENVPPAEARPPEPPSTPPPEATGPVEPRPPTPPPAPAAPLAIAEIQPIPTAEAQPEKPAETPSQVNIPPAGLPEAKAPAEPSVDLGAGWTTTPPADASGRNPFGALRPPSTPARVGQIGATPTARGWVAHVSGPTGDVYATEAVPHPEQAYGRGADLIRERKWPALNNNGFALKPGTKEWSKRLEETIRDGIPPTDLSDEDLEKRAESAVGQWRMVARTERERRRATPAPEAKAPKVVETAPAEAQTVPSDRGPEGTGEATGATGLPAARGVAPSTPPEPVYVPAGEKARAAAAKAGKPEPRGSYRHETPAQTAQRRERHTADLHVAVLDAAKAVDPAVDEDALRRALDARLDLVSELDELAQEGGQSPRAILHAIAKAGGISVESEQGGGYSGELDWVRESPQLGPFGALAGVPHVFRGLTKNIRGSSETGHSLDGMVEILSQDPRFKYLEDDPEALFQILEDISRHGLQADERSTFPGTDALGINLDERWWEPQAPDEDEIPFDVEEREQDLSSGRQPGEDEPQFSQTRKDQGDLLETGEVQPRLPGAEDVRETEIATPEFDLPFALTAPTEKAGKKKAAPSLFDEEQEKPQFSRTEPAPIFYSALKQAVERKMPERASGSHILAILKNPQSGVKAEELKWSGLEPWLLGQSGNVAKADVLAFLDANAIQVQEVQKGGALRVEALGRHRWAVVDRDGKQVEVVSREDEARAIAEKGTAPTKFAQWQLPGGEGYRELLLTLPPKEKTALVYPEPLTELPEGWHPIHDSHQPNQPWGVVPAGQVHARSYRGYDYETKEKAIAGTLRLLNEERNEQVADEWRRQNEGTQFTGGHFEEPNVLAHVRFNERTDASGKRVLFIEEIQSDWHQKGRRSGYTKPEKPVPELFIHERDHDWVARDAQGLEWGTVGKGTVDGRAEAEEYLRRYITRREAEARLERRSDTVPDAPFKTTWQELAMKRMLRYAAEHGFDKLAWTTGEQQNERYDLSKHVKEVFAVKVGEDSFDVTVTDLNEQAIYDTARTGAISAKQIEDLIGKEMADKIQQQDVNTPITYEGLDLKVGGSGMKGFYDDILPRFVNKYAKAWGAKVEETRLSIPNKTVRIVEGFGSLGPAAGVVLYRNHEGELHVRGTHALNGETLGPLELPHKDLSDLDWAVGPKAAKAFSDKEWSASRAGKGWSEKVLHGEELRDLGEWTAWDGITDDYYMDPETTHRKAFTSQEAGQDWLKAQRGLAGPQVHAIAITPSMRDSVLTKGQPQFKPTGPEQVRRQALAQKRDLHTAYISMPTVKVGKRDVAVYDTGKRLTPSERGKLMANSAVQRVVTTLLDVTEEVLQTLGVTRVERVGILLDREAKGVYFPDGDRATILLNPFEHERGIDSFETIAHEVTHERVLGHGDDFKEAMTATLETLGARTQLDMEDRLDAAYASPTQHDRMDPAFENALRLYTASRGRPATAPDALGRAGGYEQRPPDDHERQGGLAGGARRHRGRVVTRAELDALAKKRGTSVAEEEARVRKAGMRVEARNPAGGTTLQATMVPGAAEFGEYVLTPAVEKVAEAVSNERNLILGVLAPARVGVAPLAAGKIRAHTSANDQRRKRANDTLKSAKRLMDGWSEQQSRAFIAVMEGDAALDTLPEKIRPIAQMFRDVLTKWRDLLIKHDLLDNYIRQYWPHEWKQESLEKKGLKKLFGRRPMQGPESFRKKRTIPTFQEGLDAGLEPPTWNPAEQLQRKIFEMSQSVKGRDLHADFVRSGIYAYVPSTQQKPEAIRDWQRVPEYALGTKYGPRSEDQKFGRVVAGHYYAPPEVVRLIENHLSPGLWGKSVIYDLYKQAGNLSTQVLLGWSSFHLWLIGLESVISKASVANEQLTRGELGPALKSALQVGPQGIVRDLVRGYHAVHEFYSRDADANETAGIIGQIIQGGGGFGWSLFEHEDAPAKFMTDVRQILGALKRFDVGTVAKKTVPLVAHGAMAAFELPTMAIMNYWVPYLKVAAFLDMAEMELRRLGPADLDEQRKVLGDAWDAVDDRFGQLRYDNLFWNNTFKQLMTGGFLSVGWQVGSLRAGLGALGQVPRLGQNVKALAAGGRAGPPGIPMRREWFGAKGAPSTYVRVRQPWLHRNASWLFSLAIIVGLIGAIRQKLLTGKNPESVKDLFYPRNGEIGPSGREERDAPISYAKDYYSWSKHPVTTLTHKLKPFLSMLYETAVNEDFYGNEVRNADDPVMKQLGDSLMHWIKRSEPIAWNNAQSRVPTNATTAERLKAWAKIQAVPFTPAAAEIERSPLEQYLHDRLPPVHRTQEQAQKAQARRQLRADLEAKAPGSLTAATKAGLSEQSIKKTMRSEAMGALRSAYEGTTLKQAVRAYEIASPAERAQLQDMLLDKGTKRLKDEPADQQPALAKRIRAALQLPVSTSPRAAAGAR